MFNQKERFMKKILLLVMAIVTMAGTSLAGLSEHQFIGKKVGGKVTEGLISRPGLRAKKSTPKSVSYPEPSGTWSDWSDFGKGTLTLADVLDFSEADLYQYEGETPDITVDVRTDVENPAIQQYRFNGIFNNVDIVVTYYADQDGLLKMYPQSTGLESFGDTVEVMDFATGYSLIDPADYGMTPEEMDEVIEEYDTYNYYIPSLGRFYIFLGFMLSEDRSDAVAMADMQFQMEGFSSCEPKFTGDTYFGSEGGKIGIELDGVASLKYGFFDGLPGQPEIDAILEDAEGIVEITENTEVAIPVDIANCARCIAAITYDEDGTPLEWGYKVFTVAADEEGEWESLGETDFVSDVFEGLLLGAEPTAYKVEIQESKSTLGLYRLVNPFGEAYEWTEDGEYNTATNNYWVIDATNPESVLFKPQLLGVDWGGGPFVLQSIAQYYLDNGASEDDITGLCGTLTDGKITFPARGFLMWCPDWEYFGGEADNLYYTNASGETSIAVPMSGVSEISSETTVPVYYNLQGFSVKAPREGDIVIERAGNKTRKIMVK